jgi:hypothetical protein
VLQKQTLGLRGPCACLLQPPRTLPGPNNLNTSNVAEKGQNVNRLHKRGQIDTTCGTAYPCKHSSRRRHGEYSVRVLDMSVRSCRVTIRDTEGIEHSAEVTGGPRPSCDPTMQLGRGHRPELHHPSAGERYAGRATRWSSAHSINGSNNTGEVRGKSQHVPVCARFWL